jgi:uncharacterized membrane protein
MVCKEAKEYFQSPRFNYNSDNTSLRPDDLKDWSPEKVDVYYELMSKEYKSHVDGESEMHSRCATLLALCGVALTFLVTFFAPVLTNPIVIGLSFFVALPLTISIIFLIWVMRPMDQLIVDYLSHQKSYATAVDETELRRKIVRDLLECIEITLERNKIKTIRIRYAQDFLLIAMVMMVATFLAYMVL